MRWVHSCILPISLSSSLAPAGSKGYRRFHVEPTIDLMQSVLSPVNVGDDVVGAVQTKGLGQWLCSARWRLIAAWGSTSE